MSQGNLINKEEDFSLTQAVVEDLARILQERINEKLNSNNDEFPELAYKDREVLPNIVEFDERYSGRGKYVNGKLIIGTDKYYNKSYEDVISTIYHEFMHYLGRKYKEVVKS